MKSLKPKQMLEVFREVVEESARLHAPGRKKSGKTTKAGAKVKRVGKQAHKQRTAAE